jgi:hypothetical protein
MCQEWGNKLRGSEAHVPILCYDLLAKSTAGSKDVCELMDCLATDFMDEFSNFSSTFLSFYWSLVAPNFRHLQLILDRL